MSKKTLSFYEWSKLSKKDRQEKYHLLSKHDRFIQRTSSLSDELNLTIEKSEHVISENEESEAIEFLKDYVKKRRSNKKC